MKKTMSAMIFTAVLALGITLPAAGAEVDQILDRMAESSARLEDMQADFVQTKIMTVFDETIVSSGKFYFRNPDKLVLDTQNPEHQQLIINHNRGWLHYPDLKQVHEFTVKQAQDMSALFVGFGGSAARIREQFKVNLQSRAADSTGAMLITLELTPIQGTSAASPVLGIQKVLLTVPEGRWYPVRTEIVQKNGDRSVYEYTHHRLNLKLAESRFTFKVPEGTTVIQHSPDSGVTQ